MSKFEQQSISIAGAEPIVFHFTGDVCRADLAGAKLYIEARSDDGADMRLTDASGEILADLVVNARSHRNLTENVIDVGSALLWSHWRWMEANKAA
jgi:hypothetical protein